LIDHGGIWLLEMNKFAVEHVETEQQRWLKFFKEGERLDETRLPVWMQTDEMRQAMSTLKAFSEKERAYHAYQARQNYLREQRSIQRHMEMLETQKAMLETEKEMLETEKGTLQTQKEKLETEKEKLETEKEKLETEKETLQTEKEQERAAKEAALQETNAALAEIARLKALLRDT